MPTYLSVALLAIAVVVMLTLHIFLIRWGLTRGRRWFIDESNTGDTEMQTQVTAHGLLPGDVEKLPSYNYDNGGGEANSTGTSTCAICLEFYSFGDKCRLLPQCKHSFHVDCIDSWLMKSVLCPICRGSVELITKDEMHASKAPGPCV